MIQAQKLRQACARAMQYVAESTALAGVVIILLSSLWSAEANAQNCGGDGQRACCIAEAAFGACMDGLIEIPGCTGDCDCSNNIFESNSSCAAPTPCGGDGERGCCLGEAGFGACEAGLVEYPFPNAGFCTNLPGTQSSTICGTPIPCGGADQRACCIGEASFGACQDGLVEQPLPNSGQCANQPPGVQSNSVCRTVSDCGGDGQRACCVGEAEFGACMAGFNEVAIAPQFGQCGNLAWGTWSTTSCEAITPCGGPNQRACCVGENPAIGACDASQGLVEEPVANTGQCSNLAPGIESQGLCRPTTACGGDGQRACCLGEAAFGACMTGNVEVSQVTNEQCSNFPWGTNSSSVCEAVTPCGGPGQRACCVTEAGFGACQAGVKEVPGCAGDCLCDTGLTANSTCVAPTPCGGLGQRACCVGEGTACSAGLDEIPGCTGDCFCGANATPAAVFSSSMCGDMADSSGGITQIPEPDLDCEDCTIRPQQPNSGFCNVRGISDMHAHMFAHLGHGGAAFIGAPYDPQGGVNEALKQDYGTDMDVVSAFEGGLPLPLVDDGLAPDCPPYLLNTGVCDGQTLWHGDHLLFDDPTGTGSNDVPGAPLGAPLFNGWPAYTTTVHQQMYYKWIERAFRGGLRHMVLQAVHSEAFCEVSIQKAGVDCADSMAQIDLQIEAAHAFEAWLDQQSGGPGQGWFRIVETPSEARTTILQGKLAVTLAIEVDNLFNCKATGPCPNMPTRPQLDTVQKAIDFYYDWGVRHVFPVHNFDNAFAGSATWLDPLAAGNRLVEYEWQQTQDCEDAPDFEPGYGFRHSNIGVDGLRAAGCAFSNGPLISCDLSDISPPYITQTSCNANGLTPRGVDLMQRLMDKGMIIDIDHMSNESLNDTINMANRPDQVPYPLVASHGLFFDLHKQLYDDPTNPGQGQEGRHERLRTRAQLDKLRDLGSLIAVMTMDDVQVGDKFRSKQTVAHTPDPAFGFPTIDDDCRHSTKTWTQAYQYAVEVMNGAPVALGTDFNGVAAHLGPRFGSSGCGGEEGVVDLSETRKEERSAQERADNRLVYPFESDLRSSSQFNRPVIGQRTYDFNTDGLAHIGLLPDMIADVRNLGMSEANMEPLYRSANRYMQVWEQARGETCDASTDSDSDGIIDGLDNCPNAVNPDQTDSDSDGIGNACDINTWYLQDVVLDDGTRATGSFNVNGFGSIALGMEITTQETTTSLGNFFPGRTYTSFGGVLNFSLFGSVFTGPGAATFHIRTQGLIGPEGGTLQLDTFGSGESFCNFQDLPFDCFLDPSPGAQFPNRRVVSGTITTNPAPDADSDGHPDNYDNCTDAANVSQFDADEDGYGNQCDADFNNDCIVNVIDLGLLRTQFFTSAELQDLNEDGVVNVIDLGLLRTMFFQPPGPAANGNCP